MIDLCLSVLPWARFRQTKGGLKAHVALDHSGHPPAFVTVTDGRTADIEAARTLTLPRESIVVADRAHMDFKPLPWPDSRPIRAPNLTWSPRYLCSAKWRSGMSKARLKCAFTDSGLPSS